MLGWVTKWRFFRTKWHRHGHYEESRDEVVILWVSLVPAWMEKMRVSVYSHSSWCPFKRIGWLRQAGSGGTTHVFATPNGNCPSLQKRVFIPLSIIFLLLSSWKKINSIQFYVPRILESSTILTRYLLTKSTSKIDPFIPSLRCLIVRTVFWPQPSLLSIERGGGLKGVRVREPSPV